MQNFSESVGRKMEENGFLRDVAGVDFEGVVEAIIRAKNLHRGVLLNGMCGSGKTCALRAWRTSKKDRALVVRCGNASDVKWLDVTDEDCMSLARGGHYYIDDIGAERVASSFGVKYEAVGEFISWAYEDMLSAPYDGVPMVTTNLSSTEIAARYGQRIISRLREMFVVYTFKGAEKRRIQKII